MASIPPALGTPAAAALDHGYLGEPNIGALEARGIEPHIATGREPHRQDWRAYFAAAPEPPPVDAGLKERMAYKLRTAAGKAIYRLRKCTVEPVIGSIQEGRGFRQFSLRGLAAAAGECCPVCLAWNLKRLHRLTLGYGRPSAGDGPPTARTSGTRRRREDGGTDICPPAGRTGRAAGWLMHLRPLLSDRLLGQYSRRTHAVGMPIRGPYRLPILLRSRFPSTLLGE